MRFLASTSLLGLLAARLAAADCDQNAKDDALEVAPAGLGFRIAGKVAVDGTGGVLEVADFGGDGRPDLALLHEEPPELEVLAPAAPWRFARSAAAALEGRPAHFALADLDGDGGPEAAVTVGFGLQVVASQGTDLEAGPLILIGS